MALPKIKCNGYTFTPNGWSGTMPQTTLEMLDMQEDQCSLNIATIEVAIPDLKNRIVVLSRDYQIADELSAIKRTRVGYIFFNLLTVLAIGVGAYFSFYKRDFDLGKGCGALAGLFAFASSQFAKYNKKASFDAANKIVSEYQNSGTLVCSYSAYAVSV